MAHEQKKVDHLDKMCARTCCPCNLDVDALKPLVAKPEYICKSCGHVAGDDTLLCEPTPFA